MEDLLNYIEDLAGRKDVPDQIYKDLIEKYAVIRNNKQKQKKQYILRVLETKMKESVNENYEIYHKIKTFEISKENYLYLQYARKVKEFDPVFPMDADDAPNKGWWEDGDCCPMTLRTLGDKTILSNEKFLFLSINEIKGFF